jgi:hypothetical protein
LWSFIDVSWVLTTSIGSNEEAPRARAELKVEDGDEGKGLIRIAELKTADLYTQLSLLFHQGHLMTGID